LQTCLPVAGHLILKKKQNKLPAEAKKNSRVRVVEGRNGNDGKLLIYSAPIN
jgi:hypothetical protein